MSMFYVKRHLCQSHPFLIKIKYSLIEKKSKQSKECVANNNNQKINLCMEF